MQYKVVRAFERWEGKALRKYLRGDVIPCKEAAKMAIKLQNARSSSLDTLVASGVIYAIPDEVKPDGKVP